MRKLHDLEVSEVSLVPKGANKKKFLIFKSAAVAKDELSTEGRKHIASSNFAIPSERKYPIHDISHARNALARVAQHGSPEEKAKVKAAVERKYPSLKKSVEKDAPSLSDKAKLALKATARILAPHKDELSTDHLHDIANAVGIGGGPENEGMPLEGSAGRTTPLESDERADEALDNEKAPASKEEEKHDPENLKNLEESFEHFLSEEGAEGLEKDMMDYLHKAFMGKVSKGDEMGKDEELCKVVGESHEDEMKASGLSEDNEGKSGESAAEASGLEKAKKHDNYDDMDNDLEDDDVDEEDENDSEEVEMEDSEAMSPEKIVAHKAGMAAYKKAVDGLVKKLGYRMYPDEKELMKTKDGKPVEEEEVGKTSVSKSDTLDLTAVPEKVRPNIEKIFKSQKELVKKNAELTTKIEEMEKAAKKKEFIAKAATFKHYTGNREELAEHLMKLDAIDPKLCASHEAQLRALDGAKEAVAKGLFNEIGSSLPENGNDFEAKVDARVNEIVTKSGGSKTYEQVYADFIGSPEGQRMYREYKDNRKDGI